MKCGAWLITFRRFGETDDCIIMLESKVKLLWWMLTVGIRCKGVLIAFLEDDEDG